MTKRIRRLEGGNFRPRYTVGKEYKVIKEDVHRSGYHKITDDRGNLRSVSKTGKYWEDVEPSAPVDKCLRRLSGNHDPDNGWTIGKLYERLGESGGFWNVIDDRGRERNVSPRGMYWGIVGAPEKPKEHKTAPLGYALRTGCTRGIKSYTQGKYYPILRELGTTKVSIACDTGPEYPITFNGDCWERLESLPVHTVPPMYPENPCSEIFRDDPYLAQTFPEVSEVIGYPEETNQSVLDLLTITREHETMSKLTIETGVTLVNKIESTAIPMTGYLDMIQKERNEVSTLESFGVEESSVAVASLIAGHNENIAKLVGLLDDNYSPEPVESTETTEESK